MTKEEKIILAVSLIDQIKVDLGCLGQGDLIDRCQTNLGTLEGLVFGERVKVTEPIEPALEQAELAM